MPEPVILYVEDDALSCEVMSTLLKRGMGLNHVTIFQDSIDFEDRLRALELRPDVIFIDIHVEPLDGFTMLDLIRLHDEYSLTKVVAITASVMNEEVNMLRRAGFDGVIAKPLDVDVFPAVFHRILNNEQVWQIK